MVLTKGSTLLPDTGGNSLVVDGVLLCSILTVLAYVIFARDVFALLSPEVVVVETLKGFDSQWMEIVRQEWSARAIPRSMHIARDPMIMMERILVSALERGDIHSFQASLLILRERISSICTEHDGGIIDAYLSDRLGTVVQVAAEHHADSALEFFCRIVGEITTPSSESLRTTDLTRADAPLGSRLLRQIVDWSIAYKLIDSATRAVHRIESRAVKSVEALPPFSGLWLANKENFGRQMPDSEREAMQKNDWRLGNYVQGYLDYLGEIGRKAIDTEMAGVASSASHSLSIQVITIVEHIEEESYQLYLLNNAPFAFDKIVGAACAKRTVGVVQLLLLDFALKKVVHKNVALTISRWLSSIVLDMAKVGVLDYMTVVDFAVATISMASHNPEIAPQAIEVLGQVGELLQSLENFSGRKDMVFVRDEVIQRIGQIEQVGSQHGVEKIHEAADQARERISRQK